MTTPRLIADCVFVIAIAVGGFLFNNQRLQLKAANERYANDISAAVEKVIIKNNTVEIFKKGDTVFKTVYLPAEGGQEVQCSSTGVISVKNKSMGWTFKPGMGLILGSYGFGWQIDSKFAYWGRYSAGVGFNTHAGSVWVSRHVDDWGLAIIKNAELFLTYNAIRKSDVGTMSIGIRANF